MSSPIVIAIDGPAGAGKSTVARKVARQLGFLYVDSGATYRAAALKVLKSGIPLDNTRQVIEVVLRANIRLLTENLETRVFLDEQDVSAEIRTPEVSQAASTVARLPEVRQKMVALQRGSTDPAGRGAAPGVVMEGRDIGTAVFPDASLKIFLKADPDERARRRLKQDQVEGQLGEKAGDVSRTAQEIARRDKSDVERRISPLVPAADAFEIDSTHLSADEVVDRILRLARDRGLVG